MIATNESDMSDATNADELTPVNIPDEVVSTAPAAELDKSDFMTLIANALKAGTINSAQAKKMRQELGVFQGAFTKKKASGKVKKAKRKAQKKARAITRENGFKGQKMTKGRTQGRGR